jgi:quercetin dioxygenase-like cupin family protein
MNKSRILNSLFSLLILCLVASNTPAQQTGPTETKGMTVVKTTSSDLGQEIEGMQGRQLRMRVLVLDPGVTIAMHKQINRPEVIYILLGAITEYQNGSMIQRNAGDTWTAGKEIIHSVQNTRTGPATIVVTDVFKVQ